MNANLNLREIVEKANEWAITNTKKMPWAQNHFHDFSRTATQEEFLKSQEGFFQAVQAFPRMLSFLAAGIETSEIRLKVVENMWETCRV